ncbi:MAG: trypsin-like serine protease [Bacteriovoracaceae bacterium]|jgi:V8-like Glu-specific endopeptidase|nr:trypsin-like serine protease [Bacteriovoracaceae bacterium]
MKRKSLIILVAIGWLSVGLASNEKTICGQQDDRVPSFNPKIARVLKIGAPAGCTLTMIGRTCAISAGHCISTFEAAEFNTPLSSGGTIQHPPKEDIYMVDKSTLVYKNGGMGNDYAVLRLKANAITGKLAGDLQGHYDVSFNMPETGDMVRITGYGADRADRERNFAQQTHNGPIERLSRSSAVMNHRADTMGGNSGSSIIHENTGKIIAIHTHGGCSRRGGANGSTLLAAHKKAQAAIKACLQWENDNL